MRVNVEHPLHSQGHESEEEDSEHEAQVFRNDDEVVEAEGRGGSNGGDKRARGEHLTCRFSCWLEKQLRGEVEACSE